MMNQSDNLFCVKVLKSLQKHRRAAPFLAPVDPVIQNCLEYIDVPENLIDLGTIQEKLRKDECTKVDEVVADVNLMLRTVISTTTTGTLSLRMRKDWKTFSARA